jgi:hypothetical protein
VISTAVDACLLGIVSMAAGMVAYLCNCVHESVGGCTFHTRAGCLHSTAGVNEVCGQLKMSLSVLCT